MTITPMQPLSSIDWTKVKMAKVTLEAPYKKGGLRFRMGTTDAKKNLSFNPHVPETGTPHIPGAPIMFPEDAPAIAGDPLRDSWNMPADIEATVITLREEGRRGPGGDTVGHALFMAFGFFMAPKETPKGSPAGFTIGDERTRVAAMWGWYKMPPGDGTMNPPMNRIGPPDIPRVAIRPLDKNFRPIKDENGEDIVIRPFEFWAFDDPTLYDIPQEMAEQKSENDDLRQQIAELRSLIQGKAQHGKQ